MGRNRITIALLALAVIFLAGIGTPTSLTPSVALGEFQQSALHTELLSPQASDGAVGVVDCAGVNGGGIVEFAVLRDGGIWEHRFAG